MEVRIWRGHLFWDCTLASVVNVRESPEFAALWLLWHGWLAVLPGEETVSNSESYARRTAIDNPFEQHSRCTWSAASWSPSIFRPFASADWQRCGPTTSPSLPKGPCVQNAERCERLRPLRTKSKEMFSTH